VPDSAQPSSVEAKAVSPVISSISEPAVSATSEETGFIALAQPRPDDLNSSNRSFSTPASSVSLLTTPSTISTVDTSISRRFSPRSSPEEGCYRTPP
jgi:hypothetical protein